MTAAKKRKLSNKELVKVTGGMMPKEKQSRAPLAYVVIPDEKKQTGTEQINLKKEKSKSKS